MASVVQVVQPPVPGQEPPVPEVNADGVAQEAPEASNDEAATDDNNIFEDPTPPQALEGRLAGLEPQVGTPQMMLSDAVSAGG